MTPIVIEENKDIARRYVKEIAEAGNLDRLGEFVAKDVVNHDAVSGTNADTREERGLEAFRHHVKAIVKGFSDREFDIQDMIAEDDRVMVRFVFTGTHKGAMGVEPTGERVTFSGIVVYRIEDGKIVERWSEANMLGVMQQLGAIRAQ
ncbi:MAG: ester cyclase [Halobacteria archaeon]|nr:ester cyclase [Halobacteria archaeon]